MGVIYFLKCVRKHKTNLSTNIYTTKCISKYSPGPKVEKARCRRSEGYTFWGDILVSGRSTFGIAWEGQVRT